jgi:hypothetical protein
MDIQEKTIYTKYSYLVPKNSKISKKQFHELFQDYVKHPERKSELIKKLKTLSIKKGMKSKKSIKRNKRTRKRRY